MSKEEQIALELTKLWYNSIENIPDLEIHENNIMNTYQTYLSYLQTQKEEKLSIEKMQDEIGTYRYILKKIRNLIDLDDGNFVLKEDLEEIMVGTGND